MKYSSIGRLIEKKINFIISGMIWKINDWCGNIFLNIFKIFCFISYRKFWIFNIISNFYIEYWIFVFFYLKRYVGKICGVFFVYVWCYCGFFGGFKDFWCGVWGDGEWVVEGEYGFEWVWGFGDVFGFGYIFDYEVGCFVDGFL